MAIAWDDLRFVLALRRAGSLGAAARALKVESSTVSRRMAALEAELGVQLATRAPEGVVLNEAGFLAAELAETIERGVDDLVRRVGGEDQRAEGVVRVATTDAVAAFLMSGLVPVRETHPKIRVELVVANVAHDLLRDADLALRMFRETQPTLVARKVGELGWSVFASHAYVERTGIALPAELTPRSLDGHVVIGFTDELARSPGGRWLATHARAEDIALRTGTISSTINALKSGLGVGVTPCFAVHGMPDIARLTPAIIATTEAFLVIPPHHRETVRVRIVMDAIVALFQRERAMLAG